MTRQQVQYIQPHQPIQYVQAPVRMSMDGEQPQQKVNNKAYTCVACTGLCCAVVGFAACPGPASVLCVSGVATTGGLVTVPTLKGLAVFTGLATTFFTTTLCGAKNIYS